MAADPGRKPKRKLAVERPSAQAAPEAEPDPARNPLVSPADETTLPPRFRRVLFAAVWCYVAALWLLALDQTFGWGIFGPKLPPLP